MLGKTIGQIPLFPGLAEQLKVKSFLGNRKEISLQSKMQVCLNFLAL